MSDLSLEVHPNRGETWACVCGIVHTRSQRTPQPVRHIRKYHSRTLHYFRRPPLGSGEGLSRRIAAIAIPPGLSTNLDAATVPASASVRNRDRGRRLSSNPPKAPP